MKLLKQWVLRPLLLFMLFFALAPSASAWDNCGLKEYGSNQWIKNFTYDQNSDTWSGVLPAGNSGKKFNVVGFQSEENYNSFGWNGSEKSIDSDSDYEDLEIVKDGYAFTINTNDELIVKIVGGKSNQPSKVSFIRKQNTPPETTFDFTVYVDVSKILEYNFKNDNKTNDWSSSVYAQYSNFGLGNTATKALENVGGNIWKLELKNVTKVGDVIFTCYSSVPDITDSNRKYGRTNVFSDLTNGHKYSLKLNESDWFFSKDDDGEYSTVTYTYYIHFGDDMTANAGSDLQLTAGTDVKKNGINGNKFRVYSKPDTGDIVWYGSNNALNASGQTQVNLSADGDAITLPSKDGEFTFNLTINGTTPQSIMVTAPETAYIAGSFVTTSTPWGSYPTDMTWDDSKKAWSYVASQAGDFMVSMKSGSDFWNGRYESTSGGKLTIPSNKPSNANIKAGGNVDFTLSKAGTIYFIPAENKIWYEPNTYYLRFQGADGGHEDVEFTDNSLFLEQSALVSDKIQVVVKFPEGDERVFGKTTTLEGEAPVTLAEGDNWITFSNTEEGIYAFTLTLDNEGLPETLQVAIRTPHDYTVYVDVTEAVTENPAWGSDNYGKYSGFGCEDGDKVALTKVDDNVWSLVIPGAIKSGKVKFFCGSNLGTGAYESSLEFGDVKDGNYYRLMTIPGQTYFDVSIYQRFPARIGKYYLVGDIINNYYPSPAWEMKQEGDGDTYILQPFAMRNCNVAVAIYGEDGIPRIVTPSQIVNMPDKVEGGDFQPGVLCTARYDAKSNKLTFIRVDNAVTDYVPYVGVLGENFKQRVKYTTRNNDKVFSGHTVSGMGDTKMGWQEAFIEYGNDGQPRFGVYGVTAYYNTTWPPRNNILMQSDLGEGTAPLNISTAETTMRRDSKGVMTGSEWKTYLSKDNNYYDDLDFGTDANKEYYRFYVSDMWMLGAFKIWTGWGGQKVLRGSQWEADWEKFWYWGPTNGGLKAVEPGETISGGKDGNFATPFETVDGKNIYKRAYYRTMEVFIPVKSDNSEQLSRDGVKIYLTETPGGARIDSYVKVSSDGKTQTAAYLPELMSSMPNGYKEISSYKIVRYKYEANTDISNLKQVGRDGKTYDNKFEDPAQEALVSEDKNCSYTSTADFNNAFIKDVDEKYVKDGDGILVPGMYKYCMEVVFSGDTGTTTAKVWSPYIQIVETEYVLTATCGQLVKLNAEDSDKYNAHYLVYNEQNINNGMLISLDENKRVTIAKRLNTMIPGAGDQQAEETRRIATKIFEETGTWTNMAGFMTSAPSKFISEAAVERKVTGIDLYRNDGTGGTEDWTEVENFTQLNNYWFVIRDREKDLNKRDYKVLFSGTITYQVSEGSEATTTRTVPAEATLGYTPTFPLPYFGTPEVEIVKDLDEEHNEVASTLTASHDHIEHIRANAAYGLELQAFVPVHMPKIDDTTVLEEGKTLRDMVYDKLTVNFNGKSAKPAALPTGATEYGLQYRYQSPYDWITNGKDGNACDASSWTAKKLDWKLDGSAYAAPVKPYKSANSKQTVEASVTPSFANPDASTALSPMYGVTIVYQEPVEGRDKNFIEEASQEHEYYARLSLNTFSKPGCADKIGGTKLLEKSDGAVFMAHVVAPEDADMTGKTLFNYLMPVSETTGEKPSLGGDNNDQYTNLATGHIIAQMHLDKRTVQLAINSGSSEQWKAIYNTAKTFFKTLKVEYGFAHHFKTGVDHENFDATKCQSGYVGFTGDFPYLRHDHQDPTAAAPARENTTPSKTMTWQGEDNAYVLSPVYAPTSITGDDIFTDIENIADDMLNVEVGTGYIDMLGNDGRIFAADGREVYVGAGRAEVGQGVYMVVLPGKTLKVMVK